jgi:hypothetical protein
MTNKICHMTMVLGLVAGAAGAELPPCHPMLGPLDCVAAPVPPPGGEPGPTLLAECGAATPPGAACRWPAGRVVGFEVVAVGWADPSRVLYRYDAVLLLPGPDPAAFDVPVIIENGVVNYQLTLQDSRWCATDAPRRYWEAALVPILAEECPILLDTTPPPVR